MNDGAGHRGHVGLFVCWCGLVVEGAAFGLQEVVQARIVLLIFLQLPLFSLLMMGCGVFVGLFGRQRA
ncbi:hypothetical protein BC940DRAFT_312449 [Gongronella butleri]|nr:hypothetical protein BC940DRAFT_312449 [Gongronella butleri]